MVRLFFLCQLCLLFFPLKNTLYSETVSPAPLAQPPLAQPSLALPFLGDLTAERLEFCENRLLLEGAIQGHYRLGTLSADSMEVYLEKGKKETTIDKVIVTGNVCFTSQQADTLRCDNACYYPKEGLLLCSGDTSCNTQVTIDHPLQEKNHLHLAANLLTLWLQKEEEQKEKQPVSLQSFLLQGDLTVTLSSDDKILRLQAERLEAASLQEKWSLSSPTDRCWVFYEPSAKQTDLHYVASVALIQVDPVSMQLSGDEIKGWLFDENRLSYTHVDAKKAVWQKETNRLFLQDKTSFYSDDWGLISCEGAMTIDLNRTSDRASRHLFSSGLFCWTGAIQEQSALRSIIYQGDLNWYEEMSRLLFAADEDHFIEYEEALFNLKGGRGEARLCQVNQTAFKRNKRDQPSLGLSYLLLRDHVEGRQKASSTEGVQIPRSLEAEAVEFFPHEKILLFTGSEEKKVVYKDPLHSLSITAPRLFFQQEPLSDEWRCKGEGRVRFTFSRPEQWVERKKSMW